MNTYLIKPSFLLLGCISGIPLAFSGTVLQLYFAAYGLPLTTIGALSLLGLPYSWKFLVAPALEKYFTGPCPYKFWMSVTVPMMGMLILLSGILRPDQHLHQLIFLGLMVAVFSAIFDTVFDAYRLLQSSEHQLGKNATYSSMGYRFGMLITSGLGLIFCDRFGFQSFYQVMGLLLLLLSNYIFLLPALPYEKEDVTLSLKGVYLAAFTEIRSLHHLPLLLLILSSYRFCDALLSALSSYYLREVLGYSLTSIGLIYKVSGPLAIIAGSLAAGYFIDKYGLKRLMNFFCLMQGIANWSYLWLYYQPVSTLCLLGVVFIENFFSGAATCALVVFLSQLVLDFKHKATGYALLSCSFALTRAFSGICASFLIHLLGWPNFIVLSSIFVVIPIVAYSYYLIDQDKQELDRKRIHLQEDVYPAA